MLVSLWTLLTFSSEPVLELVNKFIPEEGLKLVILQGVLPEVSLLFLPQETLPLRLYLHPLQEKVRRRVWVLTPRCLLLQG